MFGAEYVFDHLLDTLVAVLGIFGQSFANHAGEGFVDIFQVGLAAHVFHEYLRGAGTEEGHLAGEHFVEQDAEGVDVDAAVVTAGAHFGGHVMHGAHGDGLAGMDARLDGLAQAVIADLDVAVFIEDVARLEIAMDDAAIVQVGKTFGDFPQKEGGFLLAHSVGGLVN